MCRTIGVSALAFILGGCIAPPPPQPVTIAPVGGTVADDPNCREYTTQATIDGQPQQLVGRVCRQSDGSWRISEGTPAQTVGIYPPPPAYYPYYYRYHDPWFWGPPFGFAASAVFISGHRHHHHHDGHRHGHHHS